MNPRLFSFVGGDSGLWRVVGMKTLLGEPLPEAGRLDLVPGSAVSQGAVWTLRGITSNERYVMRDEKTQLVAKQQGLGRPESLCSAFIPIRKNVSWWALPQDERRKIIEEQSRHIQIGLKYLPAVARRLHHCRDLGENEPFDFLTWFEYAPSDERIFNDLLAELRSSLEWAYVDREIDIRLVRKSA